MPKVLPWNDREYALCENRNDGTLRYLKPGNLQGGWRAVPRKEIAEVMEREHKRQDFYNAFVGCWAGRTAVIMATGPMMDRMTRELAAHLAGRDDLVLIGINAASKVAKLIWKVEPDDMFDAIVGADAVHPNIWEEWGWNLAPDVPKFCKRRSYSYNWIPVKSEANPVLCAPRLYYRDSVTAAMNLALIALATDSTVKICAGPRCEWPERRLQHAAGGRILLVGVEANRRDHCYSDHADFLLDDRPDRPWEGMDGKLEAHRRLGIAARELGACVYNAAPWSVVNMHEFVDFEEFLDVPQKLRCGITAAGPPAPRKRAVDPDACSDYQGAVIEWIEGGRKGPRPERPAILQEVA